MSLGDKASTPNREQYWPGRRQRGREKDPYGGSLSITTSDSLEDDKADAASIRSALSGLSLAELTTPKLSGPPSPIDEAKDYVVGDLLKRKFLECGILPSLLDLFFDFPWNNFLHNVVYDILQQCFNGRMDVGLNRKLTVAVFDQGHLTARIVEGRKRNEESVAGPRRIRLGYMGHMNLIAEETVKLWSATHSRSPDLSRLLRSAMNGARSCQRRWKRFAKRRVDLWHSTAATKACRCRLAPVLIDDDDAGIGGAGSSSFASYCRLRSVVLRDRTMTIATMKLRGCRAR